MIGSIQEMRALTHELAMSAWTLGAIGVLFESGLVDCLREPHSVDELVARCPALSRGRIERCLAVAVAAGVVAVDGPQHRLSEGAIPFVQHPMRAALQGEIRSTLMQSLSFLDSSSDPRPQEGWRHTNVALLQAQGDASAGFPPMFKANIVCSLGDLAARLDRPGARFLDVGVGVAALAISMCRTFPELDVLGLDTFDAPLAVARDNVARASLTGRIQLRELGVEALQEEESFDLAWLPSFFIPAPLLASATARVRAALRPGGWMFFPTGSNPAAGDRQRAVFGLVNELWGGPMVSPSEAESLLKEAGLSSIRTLPGPAWAPVLIVGQR